jgi:hypothetical protein
MKLKQNEAWIGYIENGSTHDTISPSQNLLLVSFFLYHIYLNLYF